jgi:hypothetical protein
MRYHIITVALFVAAFGFYMASGTKVGISVGAFLFCAGVVCEIKKASG